MGPWTPAPLPIEHAHAASTVRRSWHLQEPVSPLVEGSGYKPFGGRALTLLERIAYPFTTNITSNAVLALARSRVDRLTIPSKLSTSFTSTSLMNETFRQVSEPRLKKFLIV